MNSYSLGISGSPLLLILFILISFLFSFYIYSRTVPQISGTKKWLLISLRTLALAFLLFAIFEPILSIITGKEEEPKIAVLLDNSLSSSITDALGDRKSLFRESVENLGITNEERFFVIGFDGEVNKIVNFNIDSVKHNGQYTDISKAIRYAINNSENENIRAAVLLTDGAFNTGENPVYQADLFGKPIYTVGIGDSTEPKDISVQSIIMNEIGYVNQPLPININVKSSGYNEGSIDVELYDNGQKVSGQNIILNDNTIQYNLTFEYTPKTEGNHNIEARITKRDGELTYKNNSISDFIKILNVKKRISIFSGAPNPDLTFIKNEIVVDKNIEIRTFIQKKGSEFNEPQPIQSDISKTELFIFVGFPIISTPQTALDMIKNELERGKSLLLIISNETDYNKLKQFQKYLPFTVLSTRQYEYLAIPDVKPQSLSNPLLRIHGTDEDMKLWNQLPPIFRTEIFVNVKPESEVAVGLKVNNTPLNEPLILSRSFQNQRTIAVLGYGIYRWKLLGYASELSKGRSETPDIFSIFINNCLKWLSVTDENKLITIKTSRKNYSNTEKIEFIAQVYDAAYSPIENAEVKVNVESGTEKRSLILNNIGNGRYTGTIANADEGLYAFEGEVHYNKKKLGSDYGKFSVGEIAIEYQNLRMNSDLLRDIANRTGGKFFLPKDASKAIEEIQNLPDFTSRYVTTKSEITIWNRPWLLALAILLLSIEWFLRKRSGMV